MLAASFRHIGYLCTVSGSWQGGELSIVRLLVLTAVMWGAAVACSNDTPVPPITPDLIQPTATTISAGGDHTCALRPDGSPVCWGSRQHGQAPWTFTDCLLLGPPSLGCPRFTAITSGGAHTCGLGPDGSWMCWGSYFHSPHMLRWWEHREGILGPGSPYPEELEPPERQERFRAISSGLGHACALRSNGEAVCWGANSSGQASAFEGEPVGAISSGAYHTCALRFDDSPVCWSENDWSLDVNTRQSIQCPPRDRPQGPRCSWRQARASEGQYPGLPPEGLRLGVVSSGGNHTCALRLDGSPVCWGFLQIGKPFEDQWYKVSSSGDSHTCALRVDSSVGPDNPSVCRGFETLIHERFGAISSGRSHTCALRLDGSPVCWGSNGKGQASPPEDERFGAISSGRSHTCGLRVDGSAVCWGDNWRGQASPPNKRFAISSGEIS